MRKTLNRTESGTENKAGKRPSFQGGASENAESAILDMSLRMLTALISTGMALEQPICSRSYKQRPMPRTRLTEVSLLESAEQ